MIVFDADILSYFAKLNRLHLLVDLFAPPLLVSPNTYRELQKGVSLGYQGLQPILQSIQDGVFEILTTTEEASARLQEVGLAVDKGEADSLAYCLAHSVPFVTNDRRAYRRGTSLGVQCISLAVLLRLFWKRGLLSRAEVQEVIVEMENRLEFVIGDRDAILG